MMYPYTRRRKRSNFAFIMTMIIVVGSIVITPIYLLTSCDGIAGIASTLQDVKGALVGTEFDCKFYDNEGNYFMSAHGEKIGLTPNTIREDTYNSNDGWGYTETMSSVITITIDGSQIESCGSTVIFVEKGLEEEVNFVEEFRKIESSANGIGDNTFFATTVNDYKNFYGKPIVVVIQSQLGDPICAYSGDDVYWEVCNDLPKTTKLMIDGKALYIHRANFQIIDKDLLG